MIALASPPRRLAGLTSCLLTAALACSGCAGLGAGGFAGPGTSASAPSVDLARPEFQRFAVANTMTELERDVRIETSDRKYEKLTPGLFWAGIGVGSIMAAATVGFGVAGLVTRNELSSGYQEGGLTRPERDDLVKQGELYNDLAVAGAVLSVISYGLSIVAYTVDWNRCGPLIRNKEKRSKKRGCSSE